MKMSSNHCNSYSPKDWKRVLLLLWLGFIWFMITLCDGKLGRNVETHIRSEDDTNILSENCHVSQGKVASFTCCAGSGCGISTSNAKEVTSNMLGSDHMFSKQCKSMTDNVKSNAECLSTEDSNENFLGSSASEDLSHPCCLENELKIGRLRTEVTYCCQNTFLWFAKILVWILVGMLVIYNIPWLHDKLWSQKHEMIQQQPLTQQQQLPKQAQFSSRTTGKWRKRLLVVFVFGGIITSIWLFWFLNEDIMFRRKETLASMCDERARMLQDQFNVSMNHVHALSILISTFHHGKQPSAIDQKTFEDYTEITAFERPLTSGVAYALRVQHFEREHIEQQYGWTIKKMEVEDQTLAQYYNPEAFSTSSVQDEYAPVIFSQKTVSHIVSIDMMSGKEDRENILRARASGKGVLTSPFKLLKSNHLGVVLTFAVYHSRLPPDATPELRINATVGYLGASYDVPSLVEKLLQQLASEQTIIVNVYDMTSKDTPIKMYGAYVADTGLLHISNLDFGDPTRKHEMHCRFKQKTSLPWQAITVSVGVLVITFLLGHIFNAAINRIAKVEHDYREMMELKHRAEAADVAKTQFLATVSHEIRTPMNGVLGMLQMLMDTNLDACQLDYAQTAHASGNELISLINKVLDQAKIESGRLELEAVPFDIRAVLDRVLSIFSGKSCEKGIELAVYVSEQVPEVVIGDQERFGQIIKNLVGNSVKFTHDKGHIFVSLHLVDEVKLPLDVKDEVLKQSLKGVQDNLNVSHNTLSGFRVVDRWKSWETFKHLGSITEEPGKIRLLVSVEDTGAGIPREAQGRIFTPFMQADSSTSRKYGGTGIGLSISKRLVNLMGGEIGFVSELDIGSTFSFTVTFRKEEAISSDTMLQPRNPYVSDFRGLRALVVDEKRIRAEVTRYHLQRLEISVDLSVSLESSCSHLSCARLKSEHYAMVLVDQEIWDKEIYLPFLNAIKMIRHGASMSKSGVPLKICLLSNCTSSAECNNLKLSGLVDYLITKPLRLSVLTSIFKHTTGKRSDTSTKPCTLRSLLKGKKILVVDDNLVNRRVAEGALKKYGAVVTCVEGGKSAVELLNPPHKFDACFMDLLMPEMDGFDATRRIRSLESKFNKTCTSKELSVDTAGDLPIWHTPILAMTADVSVATNEECTKCGMDDYVSKPFGEEELYSAVARFFETEG
ncbi:histidine kinase 2 isoform X1 [Primulina huaijiensis]|uniref:histidine kinase 2 isoform X1 n=2 Tax=Primulina huaijiensis TaxID=1492673 RepID=UPI003CC77A32